MKTLFTAHSPGYSVLFFLFTILVFFTPAWSQKKNDSGNSDYVFLTPVVEIPKSIAIRRNMKRAIIAAYKNYPFANRNLYYAEDNSEDETDSGSETDNTKSKKTAPQKSILVIFFGDMKKHIGVENHYHNGKLIQFRRAEGEGSDEKNITATIALLQKAQFTVPSGRRANLLLHPIGVNGDTASAASQAVTEIIRTFLESLYDTEIPSYTISDGATNNPPWIRNENIQNSAQAEIEIRSSISFYADACALSIRILKSDKLEYSFENEFFTDSKTEFLLEQIPQFLSQYTSLSPVTFSLSIPSGEADHALISIQGQKSFIMKKGEKKEIKLPRAPYRISAVSEGCEPYSENITVAEKNPLFEIKMNELPPPITFIISVPGEPANTGRLIVDDRKPLTVSHGDRTLLRLGKGKYSYSVAISGCIEKKGTVTLAEKEKKEVPVNLEIIPTGFSSKTTIIPFEVGSIKMIQIPSGYFVSGSKDMPNETPAYIIHISNSFAISETEITMDLYNIVMGKKAPKNNQDFPAEFVSWHEAAAWCEKLSALTKRKFSLPTEAQWEYACRAGTVTPYPWGEKSDPAVAGYNEKGTAPVKKLKPNAWGIFDMSHNVGEWVLDWYEPNRQKLSVFTDPTGPADGTRKVIKGGDVDYFKPDFRSSMRRAAEPDTKAMGVGFRVVMLD